ncbi:MAG: Ribonuclease HIII [Candidatus Izimaplasma bacterium HR2]|nr:MAG: Ribonuclease HIII [Candidatus Izimaplasma bacterium HR2]
MNFVMKLTKNETLKIVKFYRDYASDSKNESVLFFAKTEFVAITVYSSNKVMFQGEDASAEYKMWVAMLNYNDDTSPKKPSITKKIEQVQDYFLESIGSDEVGTGDFFGPVTVCAAYLDYRNIEFVKTLGIDDSKKLTDDKILVLGEQLASKITFSLLTLHNEKFNDLTEKGYNLNKLKAYLHNKAILNLLAKLNTEPSVIMDQFAEKNLYFSYLKDEDNVYRDITFKTKGESKHASIAIASIIARYAFLKHFDKMSIDSGFTLLKGASKEVDLLTANIISEKGEQFLRKYAKVNFKTLAKAKDILKDM